MRKLLKQGLALILCFAMLSGFFASGIASISAEAVSTVYFYSDGDLIATAVVDDNGDFEYPQLEKLGYDFLGWRVEGNNYYAIWSVANYATAYFYLDDNHKQLFATAVIDDAGNFEYPTDDPVLEGRIFAGWDEDGENCYVALWYSMIYIITCYDEQGMLVFSSPCYYGSRVNLPSYTAPEGYEFIGWCDEEGNIYNDSLSMPAKDLELHATYIVSNQPITHYGKLEEYESTVILNGNTDWISKICIDGQWFNLYEDYEYQERIENYKNKQVVAVVYNGYVSSIALLTELKTNPEFYDVDSSVPTLEYYDGVFRKYNGSRADKWYTANGTISNPLSNSLIDASKIPSSDFLEFKNVSVTIKSSDKSIISLDDGFWDIESDKMTIELGDIEVGKTISFSKEILNLKTGWNFPKDKKEHSVTIYYTVTGTVNGEKITRDYSENIKLINKDYITGESGTSTLPSISYKKQSIRALFEEMQSKVLQCDALDSTERALVHSIISSHLAAMGVADFKNTLDAAEKVYEIARYVSGIDSVTYWTAGEYVIDAIWDEVYKGDDELKKEMKKCLEGLRDCEEFNTFIQWYYDQQGTYKNSNKRTDVRCPVDVYAYDKNGRLVLSIVGNEVIKADEEIHVFVCDDDKIIYLPTDADYNVKIIATDNGTMDYIVTEYSSDGELRKTSYQDITFVKDEYFTGTIVSETVPEAYGYNLYNVDGEEITYDDSDIISNEHISGEWEMMKEATCTESGLKVKKCNICGTITEAETVPIFNHTDVDGNGLCDDCNKSVKDVYVSISKLSDRTINYMESVKLYATSSNLPEGYKIKWVAEGDGVTIKPSATGNTCIVTSTSTGNVVIKAYVVDSNGKVVTDENGKQIFDSEYFYSEANLWLRIVYFFKKLFGISMTTAQIFKGTI